MRWIVSTEKDISVDKNQLKARSKYINRVTKAYVTEWNFMKIDGQIEEKFLYCMSGEGINGTFITAHFSDVNRLCFLKQICTGKFIVANTCIWESMLHKKLIWEIMCINRDIELFFAKQELSIDQNGIFRQSNTINNYGLFGFQTSVSERELFKNRNDVLLQAICNSFIRVSPIIGAN